MHFGEDNLQNVAWLAKTESSDLFIFFFGIVCI